MNFLLKWALKTVVGRWVTASLIALLLSGGVWKWYDFKDDLRDEGIQECVQEINKATLDALEQQMLDEQAANATLRAALIASATINQEATKRRNELSNQLASLRGTMREQREHDETYREWSDAPLPAGVATRLREAAGSEAGSTD